MGGLSQYMGEHGGLKTTFLQFMKSLKNTCEGVHLLKLQAKSLQAWNFTKNEHCHTYFQGFQLDFKLFIVFQNSKNTYFSKHLSMAASASTCNNSHICMFNLPAKCFPFLLFTLTHLSYLYSLSHRLTELSVSLFYLIKLIFFKNI